MDAILKANCACVPSLTLKVQGWFKKWKLCVNIQEGYEIKDGEKILLTRAKKVTNLFISGITIFLYAEEARMLWNRL